MEGQGTSMAGLLVDDLVFGRGKAASYQRRPVLFSIVPFALVFWYAHSWRLRRRVLSLRLHGRTVNPLANPRDRSAKRLMWRLLRHAKYYLKYLLNKW